MNAFNTLRPRQDGHYFADDVLKCIFLNENVWNSINISLKFVSRDPIHNISALVQIMAWRRPGVKPLSEPMMVTLPTHMCVTRPQWVNQVHKLSLISMLKSSSAYFIWISVWCIDFQRLCLNHLDHVIYLRESLSLNRFTLKGPCQHDTL